MVKFYFFNTISGSSLCSLFFFFKFSFSYSVKFHVHLSYPISLFFSSNKISIYTGFKPNSSPFLFDQTNQQVLKPYFSLYVVCRSRILLFKFLKVEEERMLFNGFLRIVILHKPCAECKTSIYRLGH